MIKTIWGSTDKPVSSRRLASVLESRSESDGYLFIGYPIIGTPDGPFPIDALWVSPSRGVVLFNCIEGHDFSNYEELQDESANKLESKFRTHRQLMKGRSLLAVPFPITYAPLYRDILISDPNYPITNDDNLNSIIDSICFDNHEVYNHVLSIVEAISTIKKGRKKRNPKKDHSRGAILKNLEDSIANLDNLQGQAVIETVEGVQRIRGLAGSGKTIVLALKAAYLHSKHPEWKIAVTFHTRSLKGQFRRLINTFVIELTNEEPDWDNIQIIHAWGAPGGVEQSGIYYNYCKTNGIEFYDYMSAKNEFGRGREFRGACEKALRSVKDSIEYYDAILVDEAQDLSPEFLQLCYRYLNPPKRLVYAYDELQKLSGASLPSPEEIFGNDADGRPIVRFASVSDGVPKQDIILEKCYRNSRPILVTAHALGFGIYRNPDLKTGLGLIQMFDHSELWTDVGYSIKDGRLEDGCSVSLVRTESSSPKFLEDHSHADDLIQFHCFDSVEEQNTWLADSIIRNINSDELEPDDIVVINPDPLTTRSAVGPTRKRLYEKGVKSHLAGVDTSPDVFFDLEGESVAFTGIFRAKGNEAGMVYVINAQDCFQDYSLARGRNRLFTAMTRSKAWVRVLGVGPAMAGLITEFERVKSNGFELNFIYPTQDQRKTLNIVNRDMSLEEQNRLKKTENTIKDLLNDLEEGRVLLQDLPKSQVQKLKNFLELER